MRKGLPKHGAEILAVLLAAVAGVVAAWYVWSPSMTIEAMADAAARRDDTALTAHMDMVALRADMRKVAEDNLRQNVPSGRVVLDHRAITEILVGRLIDDVFSARGTRRILRDQVNPQASRRTLSYRISFDTPNQFTARVDAPTRIDLKFTRHGAHWMLSSIRNTPTRAVPEPQKYI